MNLLDWCDIFLWKKDGEYYVSTDGSNQMVLAIKAKYKLLGDLTSWDCEVVNVRCQFRLRYISNFELSELLDGKTGLVSIARLLNIRKVKT